MTYLAIKWNSTSVKHFVENEEMTIDRDGFVAIRSIAQRYCLKALVGKTEWFCTTIQQIVWKEQFFLAHNIFLFLKQFKSVFSKHQMILNRFIWPILALAFMKMNSECLFVSYWAIRILIKTHIFKSQVAQRKLCLINISINLGTKPCNTLEFNATLNDSESGSANRGKWLDYIDWLYKWDLLSCITIAFKNSGERQRIG